MLRPCGASLPFHKGAGLFRFFGLPLWSMRRRRAQCVWGLDSGLSTWLGAEGPSWPIPTRPL